MIKDFQKKLQAEFCQLTKAFFDATGLQAVVWSQYTPYFNDGEECFFSLHDMFFIKSMDLDHLPGRYWEMEELIYEAERSTPEDWIEEHGYPIPEIWSSYSKTSPDVLDKNVVELCEKFESLAQYNDELFKSMFSDHVTVILTPDDVETRECEHD